MERNGTEYLRYFVETERNEFISNETERNITEILQKRNGTNSNKMEWNGTERIENKTN